MSTTTIPNRTHNFVPWTVQATQDQVVEIAGGQGSYFWDSSGKRYLDFLSQLFNVNLGHGNERIIAAIQQQAEKCCVASATVMHEGRAQLGDRLEQITPGNLAKSFFTNSGSEANEIAFALARMYTGREKVLAKYRSYHGTTLGTLSVAGDPRRSLAKSGQTGGVRFFDPYCYRCDFNLSYPACALHCADALERQILLEGPDSIAALIIEPFTATAGGFPLPPAYLTRVREICDRHGIVMIADEVICGFGRTGKWFAIEHDGVVPDILTVAKGITSGYQPMGAAIVNQKIADHFENEMLPLGCTYTGHPLACAAALAAMDEYESLGVIENANEMGKKLAEAFAILKDKHACVGDARSQGLLGCLELVKDRQTKQPLVEFNTAPPLVDEIKSQFLSRGLYVFVRWNLLFVAPPLVINDAELEEGIQLIDDVLTWIDDQI